MRTIGKGRTYPFRKQPVARTKSATIAEAYAPTWNASLVLNDDILLVVSDKFLEPLHQFGMRPDECARAMDEDGAINKILTEEVAEFQELIEGVLVADRLLRAIEEAQFLTCRCG